MNGAPSSKVLDVAVIGGGIAGLALAYGLKDVDSIGLFEEGERFGGHIETWHRDGFLIEKGPDSFLALRPQVMEFIRTIGLEDEVIPTSKMPYGSFVVRSGKLLRVPEGFNLIAPSRLIPFLSSPVLSIPGKLRTLMECVIAPKRIPGDESIAAFIQRRFGRENLERIAQPMISGVYSGDPERLSAQTLLKRFCDLELKHGSVIRGLLRGPSAKAGQTAQGPRYSLFYSFKHGMDQLVRALEEGIPHGSLHARSKVMGLSKDSPDGCWVLRLANNEVVRASRVVLALPAYGSEELLREVSPTLAGCLGKIRYESIATVHLAYDHVHVRQPVQGFGFVVPRREDLSMIGCSFASSKFAGRAPAGMSLFRVFVGGAFGRPYLALDDLELVSKVRRDLEYLLSIEGKPMLTHVRRHMHAMPQYEVGHYGRITRISEEADRLGGLHLAGSAYRGIGIGDCLCEAIQMTARIKEELKIQNRS